MTITQIQYFLSVAETLNITKSAEHFFVSQQVVSRQLQLLEEDLGFALFQRYHKKLFLTECGQLLYENWKKHQKETDNVMAKARLLNRTDGMVRVGIANVKSIIDYAMPKMQQLSRQFSNIQWDCKIGSFTEIERMLDRSEIDLAITLTNELAEHHPPEQSLVLEDLELAIFVGNTHPLAASENLSIKDLVNENFLMFPEGYSLDSHQRIMLDCKLNGFIPKKIEYYTNCDELEISLIMGKGVFIGYDVFFQNSGKNLKKFPIENPKGLQTARFVVAWKYPHQAVFAQAFSQNE